MIARPEGWTFVAGAHTQTLIPPAGAEVAVIRYTEKVRPLRKLGDIVDAWLRRHPEITHTAIGDPEKLITAEGEWAALVVIDGGFQGSAARIVLGIVFADDYYARIEGIARVRTASAPRYSGIAALIFQAA